jgi:hypothetical protein
MATALIELVLGIWLLLKGVGYNLKTITTKRFDSRKIREYRI